MPVASSTFTLPTPQPSLPPTAEPSPTATGQSPTIPPRDLSERPQIWFGPLDPSPPNSDRPFSGYLDFFDLFPIDAPWQNAASHVHTFKLYGGWVAWVASEQDLRQVVQGTSARGLALAFEAGPLTATDTCTGVIEGFASSEEVIRIIEKVRAAGGVIRFVDLEHPYDAATFAQGSGACHYAPKEIAENISRFILAVRRVYPEAIFGAVETAENDVEHIARWVEAYHAVMNEDLGYFNLDLNYNQPNWTQQTKAIEDYLRSRGIEFGIFYRGEKNDASGEEWIQRAEARFVEYEVEAGGRPDRVIFQSWDPQPERSLPETDPAAFTYLIDRYFRERTALSLSASPSGNRLEISGDLTGEEEMPVANAPVLLQMVPTEAPGIDFAYTITGTVPAGAIQADVGYRINLECGECSGSADFTLHEVSYTEAGNPDNRLENRVPNPSFERGLEGWGAWGTAPVALEPAGPDFGLHVTVEPGQDAAINSSRFPTTPGVEFSATFFARVAPGSEGNGYFDLIFLSQTQELKRFMLPLEPAAQPLGQTTSDNDGRFTFSLDTLPSSRVAIEARYPGDGNHWPAYAVLELEP